MKKYVLGMAFLVGLLYLAACNEIGIQSPPGPTGPEGKSAYQVWVDAVEKGDITWTSGTDLPNYFKYIKGESGESAYDAWVEYISSGDVDDPHNPGQKWNPQNNTMVDFYNFLTGAKGEDGLTPFINTEGNWQIGDTDTGIPATGAAGETPFINQEGNWQIGTTDTGVPATGPAGDTPFINADGNWQIGTTDTGVPATGAPGTPGDTPFINADGNWQIGTTDTGVPATGAPGTPGDTPFINADGNWQIGDTDTGVPATGAPGTPGDTPFINADGNWQIGTTDTGVPATGPAGDTPFINADGNWQIGTTDTGVPATGAPGTPGDTPFINADGNWQIGTTDTGVPAAGAPGTPGDTPFINADGNWQIGTTDTGVPAAGDKVTIENDHWYINGVDTGVSAVGTKGDPGDPGPDGKQGADGQSAYALWVDDVEDGQIEEPDGYVWPNDAAHTDLAHFWYYLQGKDAEGDAPASTVMERTSLTFLESDRDGDVEIFSFQTDPGATVTMNHEGTTVSATADAQGFCSMEFPNSETREYYAVVYAEVAGKLVSYPLNVRIPIRASGYTLTVDWENVIWWDNHGNQLDNSNEEYGYVDSTVRGTEDSPYVLIRRGTDCTIWVPYRTENIAYVRVSQESGLAQFYVEASPNYLGNYEYGYIKIRLTNYDDVTGNTVVYIVAYTNQDRPVLTLTFKATTN